MVEAVHYNLSRSRLFSLRFRYFFNRFQKPRGGRKGDPLITYLRKCPFLSGYEMDGHSHLVASYKLGKYNSCFVNRYKYIVKVKVADLDCTILIFRSTSGIASEWIVDIVVARD